MNEKDLLLKQKLSDEVLLRESILKESLKKLDNLNKDNCYNADSLKNVFEVKEALIDFKNFINEENFKRFYPDYSIAYSEIISKLENQLIGIEENERVRKLRVN